MHQLLFADDIAWVADSETRLQKLTGYESKSKVIKCTRMVDDRRMNVTLNGKLLMEVECFKYLGSHITNDGRMDREVQFRMTEVGKMCRRMKKVCKCKSLGINT